jgi:Uma2 family endonuclease
VNPPGAISFVTLCDERSSVLIQERKSADEAIVAWGIMENVEANAGGRMKPKVHERDAPVHDEPFGLVVRLRPVLELSPDQLLELSSLNDDLRLEMTAKGELIVMTPAGGESSRQNLKLAVRLGVWAERDGTGVAFDSSGGFVLPNGAIPSPDASWVERSRFEALTAEQRKKFLPLCPDFVIELRSPSDRLKAIQDKMQEYLENGAKLGWLIDPDQKRVYVYRPEEPVRVLENPKKVSGDPVLAGFVLDLREVW